MAKIAYVTNGMASTLNSSVEFSRRLCRAGHEVHYVSHVDVSGALAAAGYPFHHLRAGNEMREQHRRIRAELSPQPLLSRLYRGMVAGRRLHRNSLLDTEFERVIETIQPDLVIVDIEMHFAMLVLLRLKLPVLTVIVWFSIFRSRSLPPLHTRLFPPQTAGQRLMVMLEWAKLLSHRWLNRWLRPWSLTRLRYRFRPVDYGTNHPEQLAELARANGIRLRQLADWTHWLKPHVYRQIPVLSFNAYELEFPHDPPSQLSYVGPMVCTARDAAKVPAAERRRLDEFVQQCEDSKRPIVYCSLGTYWSADQQFLKKVISAASGQTQWALVIGLGGKLEPAELQQTASHVFVMKYAPQLDVLQHASLAVTHGGITTINECLHFGVPMLVCSTGHVDQDGCAARMEYHRVAASLDIVDATPKRIAADVSKLLGDEDLRQRVARMQAVIHRYAEEETAVRIVEQTLSESID